MNNNNNNRNNRRRGRGNRNNQGSGNQLNRIDSRARGNAPQLLDKYKKLAQDAQHNGDRVQAEYYLQFADHYFRVIADTKSRQDEPRFKRRDERGENGDDFEDEGEELDNRRDMRPRHQRDDDRDSDDSHGEDRRDFRRAQRDDEHEGDSAEVEASDDSGQSIEEERRERRPRQPRGRRPDGNVAAAANDGEFDVAVLPPAIGASDEDGEKRKPTLRRRRKPADDSEVSAAG